MEVTNQTKGVDMDLNTELPEVITSLEPLEINPNSLCAALAKVPDQRGKKGRLYRASVVLTLLVLAKLAGQTTPTGIARFNRLRQQWLCPALNLKRGRLPCANTYVYVCQQIDLAELNKILSDFFKQLSTPVVQHPQAKLRHLAMDGKALVSTLNCARADCQKVHLLELYEVETGQVLNQLNVVKKESEVTVAPRLLEGQALKGCLITADAFHTQRSWCKLVKEKGAEWLLIAKGNQPALVEDLALMFSDEAHWPKELDKRIAQSWDKGHGRIEHRRLVISSEMKEFLGQRWEGVEQVFRLEREVSSKGKERKEVVYGMVSLTAEQSSESEVLQYIRRHWRIENRLHWRKDVTLGEDRCLSRRGQTPQVLASLNNLVLGLMDYLKVKNVPEQLAKFAAHPFVALRFLLSNVIL
jgi:predicted transposase YbfD/YdcC